MSVSSHLHVSPAEYDQKIRAFIPHYEELIRETAAALRLAARPITRIVDLGVGTGALASACLEVAPRARLWGLDEDEAMMALARVRLASKRRRVELVTGSFERTALPPCDAMVASYALHHITQRRTKQAFYRRCHAALAPGGVLVSGDCAPASSPTAFARDLEVWYSHLGRTFGRAEGKRIYASWADEDVYVPLRDELRMLERAGFEVDVPWRRSPFAVVAAIKRS
jgi:tRNA (cmo5U34)-methyltransferase